MLRWLWSVISFDNVGSRAAGFATGGDFERYIYSKEMIEEINVDQRYKILSNRAQTEIYVVDAHYNQRVGRFYDISYALIVADALNKDSRINDEE